MGFSSGSQQSSGQGYSYNEGLSQAVSQSGQEIWAPQAGGLAGLYGQATKLLGQQGNAQGVAQGQVDQVMPGAQAGYGAVQRIAGGSTALDPFTDPNGDLARRQTSDLAASVGQEFNRNVLPGIRSNSGVAGQIGSSRDALARGVAAGDAARAISEGGTNFFANAYNTAANAAGQKAGMMLNAGQSLPEMGAGIYNLGMSPQSAAWAPLAAAGSIFGGPTALSSSYSLAQNQTRGEQFQKNQSSGKQFGFNFF
jgi:hypothetical protein